MVERRLKHLLLVDLFLWLSPLAWAVALAGHDDAVLLWVEWASSVWKVFVMEDGLGSGRSVLGSMLNLLGDKLDCFFTLFLI